MRTALTVERVEEDGLTLLEVADRWKMTRQRAHQILARLTPAFPGTGKRGHGARYSCEQLAEVARHRREDLQSEYDRWTERLRAIGVEE